MVFCFLFPFRDVYWNPIKTRLSPSYLIWYAVTGFILNEVLQATSGFLAGCLQKCQSVSQSFACQQTTANLSYHHVLQSCTAMIDIDIFSGDQIIKSDSLHFYFEVVPHMYCQVNLVWPKINMQFLLNFVDQGKAHTVYCQCSRGSSAGQMYHMSGWVQIPCLITQTACWDLRLQDTSARFGLRSRGTRGENYLLVSILLSSKC